MSNLNINTSFQIPNFENSINDYNKAFSKSLDEINNFNEIFNSMNQNQAQPLNAQVQFFEGFDTIDSMKVEKSDCARMASDIASSFSKGVNELNNIQRKAEHDFETLASGGDISIHDVMISAEKSNLAMQMAIQLRNQVVNAYNEFKNMAV